MRKARQGKASASPPTDPIRTYRTVQMPSSARHGKRKSENISRREKRKERQLRTVLLFMLDMSLVYAVPPSLEFFLSFFLHLIDPYMQTRHATYGTACCFVPQVCISCRSIETTKYLLASTSYNLACCQVSRVLSLLFTHAPAPASGQVLLALPQVLHFSLYVLVHCSTVSTSPAPSSPL